MSRNRWSFLTSSYQFKLTALVNLAVCSLAAATPLVARCEGGGESPPPTSQCNTGTMYCCNSVQSSNSPAALAAAGLVPVSLTGVTGQVGLTCSPLSVIGVGGNSCSAQPVCCSGNNFSGIIVVGCSPITINL